MQTLVGKDVIDIGVGEEMMMALTKSGELWVMGLNRFGELGLGHNISMLTLVLNGLVSGVEKIWVGASHTIVETPIGFFGWGQNAHSSLGLGHINVTYFPTKLDHFPSTIEHIGCGKDYTIFSTKESLYGMGSNDVELHFSQF